MALPLPEKLDGGRAIVIEDVPPGTGIGDLIGAFSPFGVIRFASVGPPAVVAFESEASATHALLVTSMKSVSLLGAFREKKLQVPPAAQATTFCNHRSGSAPPPPLLRASPKTEAAAPETKSSPDEAAKAILVSIRDEVVLRCKKLERYMDDIVKIQDQLADHLIEGLDIRPRSIQTDQTCRRSRIAAYVAEAGWKNSKRE